MPEDQVEKPNTEPASQPASQPGTVVHGNVTTGRDFVGRDQITTFVGKLVVSPWAWVSGLLVIAVALVLVGVASNARQLQSLLPTPLPTATAIAFAPAKAGESLIIVADFDNRSEGKYKGVELAQYIYDQLEKQAKKDNLKIRVEHLHDVLNEKTARPTGEIYSATLLIWGWYDSLSVKPVIERMREATYVPSAGVERLSIADPNKVEPVITGDLPNQVSYLTLLTLGLEQYSSGNLTETLPYFDAIAATVALEQLSPLNRSEVYFWRGVVHILKSDYDRAIADFDQALKLQPDYDVAYYNRGNAYYDKGDYDRAIADFTQALKIKPDDGGAYYNRGLAYILRSDYDRAIADFTQALKLQPDLAQAYYNRGLAYNYKGDYDRAIADFDQALKLQPDLAQAYNNRGLAYYDKGDYDRAIADYDQALKLQPDYDVAYYNRGLAYYDKSDYDRAIADFTQALKLKPDLAQAYYIRGLAYDKKGDKEKAIADYKKTLELSSDSTLRAQATEALDHLEAQP